MDVTGIVISGFGLTSLTYGLIKAADRGWTDAAALSTMAAGVLAIAGFVLWERRVTRAGSSGSPGRRSLPLVDLSLFRSAGFTWGTVLSTLVSFALFGLVFAMPQYFRDVRGFNSLGAGLRMLPMIGGLALGLILGQRLQTPRKNGSGPLLGPKVVVTAGFTIMGAALAIGAGTTVTSSTGFAAAWFAVTGFGLGIAMPTALNAALGALSPSRSGSGSALITTMRQVGGTIGVAVLGTILATVYRGHLHVPGLPAQAQSAVRGSVAGGVATAQAAGSRVLLDAVRAAYVHGMDVMLWVCGGIAIASALLALAFLPNRTDSVAAEDGPQDTGAAAATAEPDKSTMST